MLDASETKSVISLATRPYRDRVSGVPISMKLGDALRFIESLVEQKSSEDVGAALAATIAPYGFPMVSCGGARETPSGPDWFFFFNSWPDEWLHEYRSNGYVRFDIVPQIARLTAMPFTWREVLGHRNESPEQVAFHERLREMGVVDGFAVPIHFPGGSEVGLCVSVATHVIDDVEERTALHLASLHAYHRCRELGGMTDANSAKSPLSQRELECLKWVLQGKSDTDIGKILDISHTTVHFHIERLKKKLGVKTRIQAAAMVTTLGYL